MRADFSRFRWSPGKHFSGVRMQQGRVLLDADWNEQADIETRSKRALVRDVIGASGVPRGTGGFELAWSNDGLCIITPGVLYVDGLRCELEVEGTSLESKPFLPVLDDLEGGRTELDEGSYLFYVDAWEQLVGALEDDALREPALAGLDTTVRTRTAFRIRTMRLSATLGDRKPEDTDEWDALLEARARAKVRARVDTNVVLTDPCRLHATGGYRRLENQLYRLEVHVGGPRAEARFKWSRENGSVASRIVSGSGDRIEIAAPAPDAALGYAPGDWVEIVDPSAELRAQPGVLVRLTGVEGATLIFNPESAIPATTIDFGQLDERAIVRRWDTQDPSKPIIGNADAVNGLLLLEDGIGVELGDGKYVAGDYWTIPARTSTGDILWPDDGHGGHAAIPPDGIEHFYAPLAMLDLAAELSFPIPEAGRPTFRHLAKQFPTLTTLEARDVSITPVEGLSASVDDVQGAIAELSQRRDLKFHNARLHGWGIVDGLQIHCLPVEDPIPGADPDLARREYVIVENGYAIAPKGDDVLVTRNSETQTNLVPVVQKALAAGLISQGDLASDVPKSVALYLGEDGEVEVAPYDTEAETIRRALDGTMVMDIYNDTLLALVNWVQGQLDPNAPLNDPTELVGPARSRLSSLLTLFWQFIDADASGAYLSGTRVRDLSATAEVTDDLLLFNMWSGLRALLGGQTFCGLFDGVNFPSYGEVIDWDDWGEGIPEPRTIFGANAHRHLRIHPSKPLAYSIGYDDEIHVYRTTELSSTFRKGLIAKLKFPSASAKVQDVAFSADGQTMYAVAVMGANNADSMFASCAIGAGDAALHTWGATTILCDTHITRIEAIPGSTHVCAVAKTRAVVGGSPVVGFVCRIDPATIAANPTLVPLWPNSVGGGASISSTTTSPIYPSGKLVITSRMEQGVRQAFAYISAHTDPAKAAAGTVFNEIHRYPLFEGDNPDDQTLYYIGPIRSTGIGSGTSGTPIELEDMTAMDRASDADGADRDNELVFATTASSGRSMLKWDMEQLDHAPEWLDLETTSPTHLSANAKQRVVYVAMEDDYETRVIDLSEYFLSDNVYPVQIGPVSIAYSADRSEIVVLNHISATLTVVPIWMSNASMIDASGMEAYRADVIRAFIDLIGGLIQYFKDAICEHFLVQYREPAADARVYLGAASIRSGVVYQICNFHRRKYVHTFPNVEYWLSAVPVLPLLRWAIGFICCYEIPDFLTFINVPTKPTRKADSLFGLSASKIRNGEETGRNSDILTQIGDFIGQLSALRDLGLDALDGFLSTPPGTPPAPAALTSSFIGLPTNEASRRAEAGGVSVSNIIRADGMRPWDMFGAFLSGRSAPSGSNVDFITDASGKVRYAQANGSRSMQSTSSLDDVRAELESLKQTISAQALELESMRDEMRRASQ